MAVDISKEVFSSAPQKWQEHARGEPVVITEKGKPKLYLLSKPVFDSLRPLSDPNKGSKELLRFVVEIDALEFNSALEEWQERALKTPIGITEKGTAALYLISRPAFEKIYKGSRESLYATELSEEDKKAILDAEISREHEHLNALLEED